MSRELPELSRAELDVMKILWAEQPLSAREVHERLPAGYGWAPSTTRTTMDRMVQKGVLARRSLHGVYVYEPTISRPAGLAHLVRDFAVRVLEMDHGAVVSLLAKGNRLTPDEVRELERLLEEADDG